MLMYLTIDTVLLPGLSIKYEADAKRLLTRHVNIGSSWKRRAWVYLRKNMIPGSCRHWPRNSPVSVQIERTICNILISAFGAGRWIYFYFNHPHLYFTLDKIKICDKCVFQMSSRRYLTAKLAKLGLLKLMIRVCRPTQDL